MDFTLKKRISLVIGMFIEVCLGIGYAWSVFQNPLVQKFNWTTSSVSITFTLITAMAIFTPIVGKLQERIKPRYIVLLGGILYGGGLFLSGFLQSLVQLYIFMGICGGLGASTVCIVLTSHMIKLFPEKSGLVSGLMVAAYGSGAIFLAPIGAVLTASFGILMAFRILGVAFLIIVCVLSFFIIDLPSDWLKRTENSAKTDNDKSLPDNKDWPEMLKTPRFYILFIMFSMGTTSGLMILGHASPILQEVLKMTPQAAAFTVSFLAAANAAGRLLWGAVSDKTGRYSVLILLFLLASLSMFTLTSVRIPSIYIVALIIIELCYGGFIALIAPVTADNFGVKYVSVNYGIMFIAFAVGGTIGPRVVSVVKQSNQGDYTAAFAIAGVGCLVGLLISIDLFLRNKNLNKSVNEII